MGARIDGVDGMGGNSSEPKFVATTVTESSSPIAGSTEAPKMMLASGAHLRAHARVRTHTASRC
eukprot:3559303-Prymnesium_polylepis.1